MSRDFGLAVPEKGVNLFIVIGGIRKPLYLVDWIGSAMFCVCVVHPEEFHLSEIRASSTYYCHISETPGSAFHPL